MPSSAASGRSTRPRRPSSSADPTQEVLAWLRREPPHCTTLQPPFPNGGDPNQATAACVLSASPSRVTLLASEETLLLP